MARKQQTETQRLRKFGFVMAVAFAILGSLLLWLMMLAVMGSIMIWTNRRKNRALMPWATAIVSATILFFLILLNFIEPPFKTGLELRFADLAETPTLADWWQIVQRQQRGQ